MEQATGKKMFQEPRGNERGFEASSGRGGGRGGRGGRGGGRGRGLAQSGDTNALDAMLAKYYRAVRASVSAAPHPHAPAPASHPARGAVLLAVVRGKVSEGIDFADANARGVVVVGVPYPNVKDKRVELKRQYNNEGVSRGLLSGDQWYSQQAFRALNQAVGRCLRHRNDHGAILLADERYLRDDMTRHLPKWLRPAMRKCSGFEDSRRGLRQFFAAHADDPPPIKPEEPAALKPSVGVERVGPGRKAAREPSGGHEEGFARCRRGRGRLPRGREAEGHTLAVRPRRRRRRSGDRSPAHQATVRAPRARDSHHTRRRGG